jgi:hypothetical protein
MRWALLLGCCGWLGGCGAQLYGGVTLATFDGQICGQPVRMTVQDGKERATFEVACRTADGGSATIKTVDSRAFEGQAGANAVASQALSLVDRVVAGAAALALPPPVKLIAKELVP